MYTTFWTPSVVTISSSTLRVINTVNQSIGIYIQLTVDIMTKLTCSRCGHVWESVKDSPVRCPDCGSYRWRDEPIVYCCAVCGHQWASRADGSPQRCPKCKTRRWVDGERRDHEDDTKVARLQAETEEVLSMYSSGRGCISISLETKIPLERVIRVVRSGFPQEPRTRM